MLHSGVLAELHAFQDTHIILIPGRAAVRNQFEIQKLEADETNLSPLLLLQEKKSLQMSTSLLEIATE